MDWNKTIDKIQVGLLWFVVGMTVVSLIFLMLFDFFAGVGVMLYLTGGNKYISPIISLATSGLLISTMFMGYVVVKDGFKKIGTGGVIVLVIAGCVNILDVYFDSLTADYLRYGYIVSIASVNDNNVHVLFRSLIAGISLVGENLAMAIILGMPVLKGILNNAIPESFRKPTHSNTSSNNPQYRSPQERKPSGLDRGLQPSMGNTNSHKDDSPFELFPKSEPRMSKEEMMARFGRQRKEDGE